MSTISHTLWSIAFGEHGSNEAQLLREADGNVHREVGWYDPRIYGGRMLDVCVILIATCKSFTISRNTVHYS